MAFGLFKKKNKAKSDDRYLSMTVKEVVPVTKDAVNLVFEKPSEKFEYQPGQFITIIDTIGGKKIRRAYSLCSSPFLDENPAVTIKRVDDGKMSNHIGDTYKAGMTVQIMEPMGMFTTSYDESNARNICFIGGGSGITPLISILKTMLQKEPKTRVTLIYCNRDIDSIIFRNELEQLASNNDHFSLIHILEEDSENISEIKGRLSIGIVGDLVASNDLSSAEFFICGPQPMMDVAVDGLKNAGISEDAIRMESFEAGVTSPKELLTEDTNSASNVKILLDGEEYLVPVPMNANILETALDAGLDMPYSCQSGLCTACRGKCLEGEVTTDDAEGLSEEELKEGYRLLCIGKPKTSNITIEIG